MDISYEEPDYTNDREYGIYRDDWYSLEEYIAKFFDPSKNRTIGILESTMYIRSRIIRVVLTSPLQFDR